MENFPIFTPPNLIYVDGNIEIERCKVVIQTLTRTARMVDGHQIPSAGSETILHTAKFFDGGSRDCDEAVLRPAYPKFLRSSFKSPYVF